MENDLSIPCVARGLRCLTRKMIVQKRLGVEPLEPERTEVSESHVNTSPEAESKDLLDCGT